MSEVVCPRYSLLFAHHDDRCWLCGGVGRVQNVRPEVAAAYRLGGKQAVYALLWPREEKPDGADNP